MVIHLLDSEFLKIIPPHVRVCLRQASLCVCVCLAWNLPWRPSSLELAMISLDSASRALGSQTSPPCLVRKISMPDLMSTMTGVLSSSQLESW